MLSCNQKCVDYIASRIILGIIFEPLSWPKPGNVGPLKHYQDLSLEDFIEASIILYPKLRSLIFNESLNKNYRLCYWVKELVSIISNTLNKNVILGILMLLTPIAIGLSKHYNEFCETEVVSIEKLISWSKESLERSYSENANDFLNAIAISKASIPNYKGPFPSVNEKTFITLRNFIDICSKWDMICYELNSGYKLTTRIARRINELIENGLRITEAIAKTYLETLTEAIDTHIVRRHGITQAIRTKLLVKLIIESQENKLLEILDEELRQRRINPGTIADLIAIATILHLLSRPKFL